MRCNKMQVCNVCEGTFKMERGCFLEKRCPSCRFLKLQKETQPLVLEGIIIPRDTFTKHPEYREKLAYRLGSLLQDTYTLDSTLYEISKETIYCLVLSVLKDKPIKPKSKEYNEDKNVKIFIEHYIDSFTQVELAIKYNLSKTRHTPHLKDKFKGTKMMLDYLIGHGKVDPEKVAFDHIEEHTIKMVRDNGFWVAMTNYPVTKNSPDRIIDTIEKFGLDHILVDASGDWGPSDPGTLHDVIAKMKDRKHEEKNIETIFYNNPCYFLGQNEKFKPQPTTTKEKAWNIN